MSKPIWRVVSDCAHELTRRGLAPFTRGDLIGCVQEVDQGIGAGSINPVIQGITRNLKGGAPGSVGKDILYSVGRGQFVLYEQRATHQAMVDASISSVQSASDVSALSMPKSEADLRDALVRLLRLRLRELEFHPEGRVSYRLPSGRAMTHASDVLVSKPGSPKRVSIEVKYKSAVTDQFKARAYDAEHMKREHGESIRTVLLFAKADTGISVGRARDICHSFYVFYGDSARIFLEPGGLDLLMLDIKGFLLDEQ